MDSASIAVASPHALLAEGVVGILRDAGYIVSGPLDSVDELNQHLSSETPDIVLIDGSMVDEILAHALHIFAGRRSALLVGPEKGPVLREALLAGARGFISIDTDTEQFLKSISLLLQGAMVMSAKPGELMVELSRDVLDEAVVEKLSGREQQLAILVARGASNREIAEALSISEHTVKVHLGHILTKLDLWNRQQIAVYVAQKGMLEDIPLG